MSANPSPSLSFEQGLDALTRLFCSTNYQESSRKSAVETFFQFLAQKQLDTPDDQNRMKEFLKENQCTLDVLSQALQNKNFDAVDFLFSQQLISDISEQIDLKWLHALFFYFVSKKDRSDDLMIILQLSMKKNFEGFYRNFLEEYLGDLMKYPSLEHCQGYFNFFQDLIGNLRAHKNSLALLQKLFFAFLKTQQSSVHIRSLEILIITAFKKNTFFICKPKLVYYLAVCGEKDLFIRLANGNLFTKKEYFFLFFGFWLLGLVGSCLNLLLWPIAKVVQYVKYTLENLYAIFFFLNQILFTRVWKEKML